MLCGLIGPAPEGNISQSGERSEDSMKRKPKRPKNQAIHCLGGQQQQGQHSLQQSMQHFQHLQQVHQFLQHGEREHLNLKQQPSKQSPAHQRASSRQQRHIVD